jgi:two-component system, NarL family, sensor histidine kinase DevS
MGARPSGQECSVSHPRVQAVELAGVLDRLAVMVAYWDPEARNRFATEAHVDWFGIEPEELYGKHISELLGRDLYEESRPFIERALTGEEQHFETRLRDVGGRPRYVSVTLVPHRAEDGRGFFVMTSDVTDRVRSEQALQESIRQLALLEERQRIAADLHDVVIQRLFAAGLDLAAVQRGAPEASRRIAAAAGGVDEAIRELRRAIHSLTKLMTPTQLPATIERILGNAGRGLGFVPTMTYTGSTELLPGPAVDHLLAVLTEALSNAARHAEATEVHVTLSCEPDRITLLVADNGRGIGREQRSSGLANMRQRAERLGGTFGCRDNDPRGTVLEWMVPTS